MISYLKWWDVVLFQVVMDAVMRQLSILAACLTTYVTTLLSYLTFNTIAKQTKYRELAVRVNVYLPIWL